MLTREYDVLKWLSVRAHDNGKSVLEWITRIATHRLASYNIFGGDSRINEKKAWYFLEQPVNDSGQKSRYWSLKKQFAETNGTTGLQDPAYAVDGVDNRDVLADRPVYSFEHPLTPVTIRYSV